MENNEDINKKHHRNKCRPQITKKMKVSIKTPKKNQEQACEICGEPCGKPKNGAKVYHMSCLMEATKNQREKKAI